MSGFFFKAERCWQQSRCDPPPSPPPSHMAQGERSRPKVKTPGTKQTKKRRKAKCHYLHLKINQVICVSSTTGKKKQNKKLHWCLVFSSKTLRGFCRFSRGFSCWKTLAHTVRRTIGLKGNKSRVEQQAAKRLKSKVGKKKLNQTKSAPIPSERQTGYNRLKMTIKRKFVSITTNMRITQKMSFTVKKCF